MKKLLVCSLLVILLAGSVWAQVYVYDSDWKTGLTNIHGIVIDPEGKIWVATYGVNDSIFTAQGVKKNVRAVKVFNEAGEQLMAIKTAVVGGVTDTLFNAARGISIDNEGNILYTAYNTVYRFNYQTGECTGKIVPMVASLTEAASTADGYYIIGTVLGGNPIWIYDHDLNLYSMVDDTNLGLQRSIVASADGKHVYVGKIYSGPNGIVEYYGPDGVDGEYARVDTFGTVFNDTGAVVKNMWAQCLDWGPDSLLWVGTYWDVGVNDFTGWYAIDVKTKTIVDSIGASWGKYVAGTTDVGQGKFYSPRGIAFTADGNTAYIADFEVGVVMKFKKAGIAVREDNKVTIAVDFELKQNYPNPFNPTTNIPLELKNENVVKLTVYDMLGREVATVVNEKLQPGVHTFTFDASGLPTGMYIYRVDVNGKQAAKSMMFIK